MKEELIMHNLYFGCLATDLHDFFMNTLLCVAMVTMLVKYISQNVTLHAYKRIQISFKFGGAFSLLFK